jgi:hypothetical protein
MAAAVIGCAGAADSWIAATRVNSTVSLDKRDDMRTNGLSRLAATSFAAAGLWMGLALAGVAPAAAQEKLDPVAACSGDAQSLCGDVIPDHAKVAACLRRNARSLSPDCRTVVFGGGGRVVRHRVYR